jgi:hypothetical protein
MTKEQLIKILLEDSNPIDTEVVVIGHSRGVFNEIYSVEISNETERRAGFNIKPGVDLPLICIDAG